MKTRPQNRSRPDRRMKAFYDYIYYRMCRWTSGRKGRITTGSYDTRLIALVIAVNLTTVLALCRRLLVLSGIENRTFFHAVDAVMIALWIVGILVFCFIYSYRFDDSNPKKKAGKRWKALCKRYENEPVRRRRLRGWGVLLYWLLSFAAMAWSLTLLGAR